MNATLIQCTGQKLNRKTTAYKLYSASDYFCKMRRWANLRNEPAYIVSAKHGLLKFGDEIAHYNQKGLDRQTAESVAVELDMAGVTHVTVCLGSEDYLDVLEPELAKRDITVDDPFDRMRIGKGKELLQQKINEMQHDTLC